MLSYYVSVGMQLMRSHIASDLKMYLTEEQLSYLESMWYESSFVIVINYTLFNINSSYSWTKSSFISHSFLQSNTEYAMMPQGSLPRLHYIPMNTACPLQVYSASHDATVNLIPEITEGGEVGAQQTTQTTQSLVQGKKTAVNQQKRN